jgi:hypothetical protein
MAFPNLLIAAFGHTQEPYLFLSKKFSPKTWHNTTEHYFNRIIIVDNISAILSLWQFKTRKKCKCVKKEIHLISLRLEDAFYHEASSLEQYFDLNTVQVRLQEQAFSMREHNNRKEIDENFKNLYAIYQIEDDELHENMLLAATLYELNPM